MIARYAELTSELAAEQAKLGKADGRPTFSLRMAELVEERARVAIAIADELMLAEMGRQ